MTQPTNLMSDFLKSQKANYGYVDRDLAVLMDVSPSAINRITLGTNGINDINARKLAILFGAFSEVGRLVLSAITNGEHYKRPQKPTPFDSHGWATHALQRIEDVRCPELRVDVKRNLERYLGLDEAPAPKPVPVPRPESQVVEQRLDATPIPRGLERIEAFRKQHKLTWFIKDDGSLGAKRVTVEEF